MNDHGFTVCAYNRTTSKVDHFLENEAKGKFFLLSFLCWVIQLHSFGGDEANGYGGQAGMVHFWGGWELS